jgi:hypothetical protein
LRLLSLLWWRWRDRLRWCGRVLRLDSGSVEAATGCVTTAGASRFSFVAAMAFCAAQYDRSLAASTEVVCAMPAAGIFVTSSNFLSACRSDHICDTFAILFSVSKAATVLVRKFLLTEGAGLEDVSILIVRSSTGNGTATTGAPPDICKCMYGDIKPLTLLTYGLDKIAIP